MKRFTPRRIGTICLGFIAMAPPLIGQSISDLGTLEGDRFSLALDINDRGQAVGYSGTVPLDEEEGFDHRAVLWENGRITDLGTLGGEYSRAAAINNRGQIVGQSATAADEVHAVLWEKGSIVDLGGGFSEALDINERGDIVGVNGGRATLWRKGRIIDLGTLGGTRSVARAINNKGMIVGESRTTDGNTHAVLWKNGKIIDLGTLEGEDSSTANDINDRGEIVGSSPTMTFGRRAVLWRRGRITEIGFGEALGINNRGEIVGVSNFPGGGFVLRPTLWYRGEITDLGTLVEGLPGFATAINNRGSIVGRTLANLDNVHGTLWEE